MIMRITWGKIHPGKWGQYQGAYNRVVVPKSKGIKGLQARWLVQDAVDKDAGYAVSLWDNARSLAAYERSALFKEFQAKLQPYFAGNYTTTRGDVKVAQELK